MFTIDFTKPWLYKDIIYFNQGNLSTNNTLRCKLITGGSDDFTGGSIACTFTTKNSVEISGFGRLVDAKLGIVDIVFPSNALVVGTNKLEILVNRADGGVAQSPPVMYDIWQGLTTGNGVEAETNYPILIELINSTNEASNKANLALNKANSMIADINEATDNAYRSANEADIATSNANTKIEEVETSKLEMIKKVDNSIANMKVETNTAINSMTSKTDEKITDVNRALASGTKDLEVKEARKDANGVVHDTLEQRLKSDLIVGDKSLKDFVIDMNGMKETQDLEYETNTGYKVCNDTQAGVVKDLKISGKSLFNTTRGGLTNQGSAVVEMLISTINNKELKVTKEAACVITRYGRFEKNTEYTFIIKVKYVSTINDLTFSFHDSKSNSFTIGQTNVKKKDSSDYVSYVVKVNTYNYDIDSIVVGYHGALPVNTILGIKDILVLEGDHTQNPPQYFEGIASVRNANGLEVLTHNSNFISKDFGNSWYTLGNNLNSSHVKMNGYDISVSNDKSSVGDYYVISKDTFSLPNNTECVMSFKGSSTTNNTGNTVYLLSMNDPSDYTKGYTVVANIPNSIGSVSKQFNSREYKNLVFRFNNNTPGNIFTVKDLQITTLGNNDYLSPKEDKKPVLFKDVDGTWKPVTELKGIDLTACDTIEKHSNGKHYLHVRTEKLILNGSEDWKRHTINDTANTERYALDNNYLLPNSIGICNVLPYTIDGGSDDKTCIYVHGTANRIDIRKLKTDNRWTDVPSLKTWLQANNTTIICMLKQEKVYEVNPLELESFDNITLWLILSGVIAPPASFKITSSLPNFVKSIQDQVRELQDQVYKTNVANFTVALNTLDTKLRLDRLEAPKQ
ncbi:hypothetical protein QJS64_12275 [Paraclostridium bifermentans]|uniref:Peptidase S74 domain-containing protein n=1 Tax=Paraclostridium bifermentans TaxID=1490 RepID=A0ABY8R207_PARBF|nr:hypothetical protein QJS64_12275 [Paraclostridium bifermentans]